MFILLREKIETKKSFSFYMITRKKYYSSLNEWKFHWYKEVTDKFFVDNKILLILIPPRSAYFYCVKKSIQNYLLSFTQLLQSSLNRYLTDIQPHWYKESNNKFFIDNTVVIYTVIGSHCKGYLLWTRLNFAVTSLFDE